jgi:hypothetical protein
MRTALAIFAVGALAGSAFAVNELRELRQHTEVAAVSFATPLTAPAADPDWTSAGALRKGLSAPRLSTWKGALPFGGVPDNGPVAVEGEEAGSADGIPDVEDRCPEDINGADDGDGCPDVEEHQTREITIWIDGVPRRVQIRSEIRILSRGDESRNILTY